MVLVSSIKLLGDEGTDPESKYLDWEWFNGFVDLGIETLVDPLFCSSERENMINHN